MGVKPRTDLIPLEVKERLNALLRDPAYTQKEITQWVNDYMTELGHEPVMTERVVNRYAAKMARVGSKIKQSREVAELWIGTLGSQPAGQVGQLLNEMVRTLAFDASVALSESDEPVEPKLIKELAMAIRHLEESARVNADIARRAKEEAAETMSKTAKEAGVSAETILRIRQEVLGMAA